MNGAAFLANFGWVNISSQLILPKAAFLLSSSHVLFLFLVCARHSVSTNLADCILRLHGHSGEPHPSTFLECKNFFRPIFSVLICTSSAACSPLYPLAYRCLLLPYLRSPQQRQLSFFIRWGPFYNSAALSVERRTRNRLVMCLLFFRVA